MSSRGVVRIHRRYGVSLHSQPIEAPGNCLLTVGPPAEIDRVDRCRLACHAVLCKFSRSVNDPRFGVGTPSARKQYYRIRFRMTLARGLRSSSR